MAGRVRFGILGGGRIGKMHAENMLYALPKAELLAVADPFADVIRDWAQQVGIPKLTKEADEVISDPDIDAIVICSPTDTHAEYIIACARAGKQIFCEKPISFDVKKIREALAEVKKAGVKLQIGFNRRFDSNGQKIRKAIEAGEIGDQHIVRVTSRDPAPPPIEYVKTSGGLFLDMMIHDFDMVRFLTGSEVKEVYANGTCLVDPEIGKVGDIDTAIVSLKFANGAIGMIENSRASGYGYDQRMEVFGSKGSVEADNMTESQVRTRKPEGVTGDPPVWFFIERYTQAYLRELESFIDAVDSNSPVACSGEDGLAATLIGLAATESLKTGKPVDYDKFVASFA